MPNLYLLTFPDCEKLKLAPLQLVQGLLILFELPPIIDFDPNYLEMVFH